jgi:hypothetical protein
VCSQVEELFRPCAQSPVIHVRAGRGVSFLQLEQHRIRAGFSDSVTAAPTATATATASIATSTTTAASSIATSTATTTATTTATAIFPGLGLIDSKWPAFVLLLIETLNRSLSFGVVSHLDETKSFAAAATTVSDHLGTFDRSKL